MLSSKFNVLYINLFIGLQDMAVGVNIGQSLLQSVLSYWIRAYRYCNPYNRESECPESGISGGINFNVLLSNTVEQFYCGDGITSGYETTRLQISNFILPIIIVCAVGICYILWYSYKFLRTIVPFYDQETLQEILSGNRFKDCFMKVRDGRNVLFLDRVESILENDTAEHIRLIRGACKFFLRSNMEAFFQLTRFTNLMYRGAIADEYDTKTSTSHLRHAANVSKEVKFGINLLITRAIHQSYQTYGTLEDFTFVCRNEEHLELLKVADFGEKRHGSSEQHDSLFDGLITSIYNDKKRDSHGVEEHETREEFYFSDFSTRSQFQ
jgi:hypothetical protein